MNPTKIDDAGDSEDLQALFDTIAAGPKTPPPPPPPAVDPSGDNSDLQALFDSVQSANVAPPAPAVVTEIGDNADLQALFDSVAAESVEVNPGALDSGSSNQDHVAFNRLGHLARQIHDSLRELGYDRMLEDAAQQIPDARQRLSYIAEMTEVAASRVLNAADIAKPIQDDLIARSNALSARWAKMFANQLSVDEFKLLAADSRSFFDQAPVKLQATNDQLMEIMMAQDFQDLTGQVIKKVVELVNGLESQLVKVLIEVMPDDKRAVASVAAEGLMNGPVIDAAGRNDVVTSQSQVDDLLESLGF